MLVVMVVTVVGSGFWFLQRQLKPLAWLHHGVDAVGLNLCQRIVQLHGGTIRLHPREPRGTEAVVAIDRRLRST